ncbi:MAG: DUF3006 domain-containing protein [Pisciglobus halotolerans]|nr:DUF3006 domain-containing protein [Pisciglobus halotolerans]
MKGVLDRFEDQGKAVILIEKRQQELIVPKSELPKGSRENMWFTIEEQEGAFHIVAIDYELTRKKTTDAEALVNKLRTKHSHSRFRRKQ